jgi:hypothetical protein
LLHPRLLSRSGKKSGLVCQALVAELVDALP